ncbi:MAG: FecCD family ABC transporter permease [Bacillota bacterium]
MFAADEKKMVNKEDIIKEKKEKLRLFLLCLVPILLFIISFSLGRYPVTPKELITVLCSKLWSISHSLPEEIETVIFQIRLPRILAAMVIGSALATSGCAYQGMLKNPLVSPDILGASAGAGFGAALGIHLSFSIVGIQISSFFFGLAAVLLAYLVSGKMRNDPILGLVLSGILLGTLFSAGTSFIKFIADPYDKLPAITFWLMGSLASISIADLTIAFIPIIIGLIPLFLVRWRLNVMTMGEEEAKSLGINTTVLRIVVILSSTLITTAAVCISGLIGWVGLVVPHLARMLVGPNYNILLPASILIGCSYLLIVDNLARLLTTVEVPLGILTSLVGAPFFLYLIMRNRRIG